MDDEYTRHRLSPRYPVEGKGGHRTTIVGKQDSSVIGCPMQDRPVIGLPQAHVLYTNQVDGRHAPHQATHDVVVEVIVTQQT